MPPEQSTIVWIAGIVVTVIVPIIVNLRIFVRATDYDKDRMDLEKRWAIMELGISKEYVRKGDLNDFKTDLDKRLDEIKETQRDIFKVLSDLRK